jgi:hypothetical protein
VLDEVGRSQGWGMSKRGWDFDLLPWILRGKVWWIDGSDPTFTLRRELPCPYVDLPGPRAPQSIDRGKLSNLDPPTGEQAQPFE